MSSAVERDFRIDFWRGFALASIFVNHIAGNFYGAFTHRNFGLSDAAEAFVFIAGFTAALAYFPKFLSGGGILQSYRALRRAGQLYLAHIATLLIAIAMFYAAAGWFNSARLLDILDISAMIYEPHRAMIGIPLLSQQALFFNILPMYIGFLLMLPIIMLLARIDLLLALAASAALYFSTQILGLTVPHYPGTDGWFFNPLAWQFLFTIAFVAGAMMRGGSPVRYRAWAFWLAAAYLAFGLWWARHGGYPEGFSLPLPEFLWVPEKGNLTLPRLLHVLALAYVVCNLPFLRRLRNVGEDNLLVMMGRHSLPIFCTGSILSMAALIASEQLGGSLPLDTFSVVVGLGLQIALAAIIDWARRAGAPRRKPAEAGAGLTADGVPAAATALSLRFATRPV